jgi:signal transduction histidine kinase
VGLWVAWQLSIALAAAGILIAGASAGQVVIGRRRGLPAAIGPLVAVVAATAAPVRWDAPGAWPDWYPLLWILAIACLAFVRRGRALVTAVAFVAGCGAITLTWGATTRTRMQLAERDVQRLGAEDTNAADLLVRFAETLTRDREPMTRARLVQAYAASELARAGYPARLAVWTAASPAEPVADVALTVIDDEEGVQSRMAMRVRASGEANIATARDGPFTMLVAGLPLGRDSVVTIAVPPRTWLLPTDPFARLTGLAATPDRAPPYSLSLGVLAAGAPTTLSEQMTWRRVGDLMIGDAVTGGDGEPRRAHVEVDLRGLGALVPRGALLVLLDVAVVLLIWTASAMADGGFWRWFRRELSRWRRAYRSRLSVALLAFFLAPTAAFAAWEAYRLREDDQNARELLVREALRTVDLPTSRDANGLQGLLTTEALAELTDAVGGPLFAYRDGVLRQSSDPVLAELAPFGTLLPTGVPSGVQGEVLRLDTNGELLYTQSVQLARRSALVGFRPTLGPEGAPLVLATAARGDEFALDARRSDLAILVALVIVAGVLAALWLSGAAARTLARPIGTLRDAALAIASGRPMPPLDDLPPAEFVPVFGAFARMATDLSTSRAALEEAQRRTAAVLREVASGVVAVRHDGTVLLANPRAEWLLGTPLPPGTPLLGVDAENARAFGEWPRVAPRVRDFLEHPDRALSAFDVTTRTVRPADAIASGDSAAPVTTTTPERQLRASLTRLPGGAVLTLDDVTELATAQRVLAWGEMARQVAHEIKNPLTPIRLGVQHLRRAWRDGRIDFANILDTNVTRILNEIDHLDEIARAFSRYGSVPAERAPGVPVDVALVARDVIELERMGESDVVWELEIEGVPIDGSQAEVPPVIGLARAEELKEVLLNLLENARLAHARVVQMALVRDGNGVRITVRDNGDGMTPEIMTFIFQPHFSTRTSGSGLGLAISRRTLEGWGGTIAVSSEPGVGTTLTVTLQSA